MAGAALHLLVALLAFSSLVPLNGLPTSRTIHHLYEGRQTQGLEDINQIKSAEVARDEITSRSSRRMDVQMNDYPGPGANNRHTPGGD